MEKRTTCRWQDEPRKYTSEGLARDDGVNNEQRSGREAVSKMISRVEARACTVTGSDRYNAHNAERVLWWRRSLYTMLLCARCAVQVMRTRV